MLHNHRLRMAEVPVRMFERGGGRSSISSGKSAYYMIKVLLALFVGLLRRRAVPGAGRAGGRRRGARDLMDQPHPDPDHPRRRGCCWSA